jgi:hypothetical protein
MLLGSDVAEFEIQSSNRNHWTRRALGHYHVCLNDHDAELAQERVFDLRTIYPIIIQK